MFDTAVFMLLERLSCYYCYFIMVFLVLIGCSLRFGAAVIPSFIIIAGLLEPPRVIFVASNTLSLAVYPFTRGKILPSPLCWFFVLVCCCWVSLLSMNQSCDWGITFSKPCSILGVIFCSTTWLFFGVLKYFFMKVLCWFEKCYVPVVIELLLLLLIWLISVPPILP